MLALGLWAFTFGAVSGVPAYFIARNITNSLDRSLVSDILLFAKTLAFPTLPLSFVLLGGASFLTPQKMNDLRQLLQLCAFRSFVGAPLLGFIGCSVTTILGFATNEFTQDDGPPYIYGLLMGWFLGFFLGIVWGIVEGIIRLRKANSTPEVQSATPPIAAP